LSSSRPPSARQRPRLGAYACATATSVNRCRVWQQKMGAC
jgi:hypothetical protein